MSAPLRQSALLEQRLFRQAVAGAVGLPMSPLPMFAAADIWSEDKPPQYLLKRLLGPGELTVIFGKSGHLKSVIAVDIAVAVGLGLGFHGIKGRMAPVLYIAGEGHRGIKKRLRARMIAHGFDASSDQPRLLVTSRGGNLIENPEQLRVTVEAAEKTLGDPIGLLIVDTLAANFGAGDENSSGDMTAALTSAREAAPYAANLIIHHTGHSTDRERGSYALQAAADYRLQAAYDAAAKELELKWLKCKDDDMPEPMIFERRVIPVDWTDEDGEEETSVIVERLSASTRPPAERESRGGRLGAGLGANQETVLKILQRLYRLHRKHLEGDARNPADAKVPLSALRSAVLDERHMNRQRFNDAIKALVERGMVLEDSPFVFLKEDDERTK